MISRNRNNMLNRGRGMEGYLLSVLEGWERRGKVRRYAGRCSHEEQRKSMFVGGDPSCFLLLEEVVGGLFLGVFLCVLERSVFVRRIVAGFLEVEQLVAWGLEVVLVRGRVCMFVELG